MVWLSKDHLSKFYVAFYVIKVLSKTKSYQKSFRRVYIGIYEGCFGQTKEDILELLERKSGLIRDYMSDDVLDILNMAETTIHVQLSLAKRKRN